MRVKPRWFVLVAVVGFLPALLLACATIIHGSSQEIAISSQPTGADVMVDNKPLGKTPVVADLKRKNIHLVRITLEGYQPFEMNITRSVSPRSGHA